MADPNEQPKSEDTSEPGSAGASGPPSGETAEAKTDLAKDETAPAKPRAAKKRRAETADAEEGEPRDRNKRIREEAAAKRRAKREAETRRAAPARNLDASEIVDDALVRTTHAAGAWLKKHLNLVQWVIILGVIGGIGYQIYSYRRGLTIDKAAEELARAMRVEGARVGPTDSPGPDRYTGLTDTRQEFPSEEARLKAAEAEYRKAETATSGSASGLATLGLAGVLYDQGKFEEARKAYERVKGSSLADKDRDARGRAIEGIGLSLEAQGKPEAALSAFRELANTDVVGLKELGQYHQARILLARGERDKAKDLLKSLVEKLSKAEDKERSGLVLVERQAQELLAMVDPSAVPKPAGGITPEQLERLKEQLKLKGGDGVDASQLEEVLRQLGGPSPAPSPEGAPAPAQTTEPSPAPAQPAPAPLEETP